MGSVHSLALERAAIRPALSRIARWLRADVADVVSIEPATHPTHGTPRKAADTRSGLARWRGRLARRRALVLARRYLMVALAFATGIELVLVFAGGKRLSPWLLVPLVLALAAGAVQSGRRVSLEQTAWMLDAGLGLANRVGTAVELAATQTGPPNRTRGLADEARAGLAARVLEESDAAVARSFRDAHVVTRRSPAESAWLIGAAGVVALLVALPGIGLQGRSSNGAAPNRQLSAGRGTGAGGAHRVSAKRTAGLPTGANVDTVPDVRLNISSGQADNKLAHRLTGSLYGHLYGSGGPQLSSKQLASEGLASTAVGAKVTAAPGVASAVASPGSAPASHGSANAGQSANSRTSSAGGLSAPGGSSGSSAGATRAGGSGGAKPGNKGAAAGGGKSGAQSGGAPPGGESAGGTTGSNKLTAGLVPDLPSGTAGLPLEAGYAPGTSKQSAGNEGVSQTPNGGGGSSRSAQTNDRSSASGTSFAVIPPTPNSTTTADQGLLDNYFGSVDQLRFDNW
jgi:hypothetical protein